MPNQFLSPEGDLEKYYVTEYDLIDKYVGSQLWTWGVSNLGDTQGERYTPTLINSPDGSNFKKLSVGNGFFGVITENDDIYMCGVNTLGQLSQNDTTSRPTQLSKVLYSGTQESKKTWVQLSCSGYHTLALDSNGSVWGCGRNDYGQVGLGYTNNTGVLILTKVGVGTDWRLISSSALHSLGIKVDGTLWAWGDNSNGQIGIGTSSIKFTSNPTLVTAGVGNTTKWKIASAGNQMSSGIDENGRLWVWGSNVDNILGLGANPIYSGITTTAIIYSPVLLDNNSNWKIVNSGRQSHAIKSDGTLWAWGRNQQGQLGVNLADETVNTPTQVGIGKDWKYVVSGNNSVIAVKTNGTLWAWGTNKELQLAQDDKAIRQYTPIQINTGDQTWKYADVRIGVSAAISVGITPEMS